MSKTNSIDSFAYNYSFVSEYERNFDTTFATEWMSRNWNSAFYYVIIYAVIIFSGQEWMKNRQPYNLRPILFLWNIILATFSVMGTFRTLPEFIDILSRQGLESSVCNNRFITSKVTGLWLWLYCISKAPELLDTVFIVLRKQKLIFLHWYHHMTVLIFSWLAYSDLSSVGRWYYVTNYSIHAVMYSYYALRALNIRVPKLIQKLITFSQIIQMICGIFVTLYAVRMKSKGKTCLTSYSILYSGTVMYFSYFLLFVNFFINSYFNSRIEKLRKSKSN